MNDHRICSESSHSTTDCRQAMSFSAPNHDPTRSSQVHYEFSTVYMILVLLGSLQPKMRMHSEQAEQT